VSTPPATDEDRRSVLAWIGRHGVATIENLSVRFGLSERSVARVLRSAAASGLVRRAGRPSEQLALFTLTLAGLEATGLTRLRPCPVAPRAEGHLRAVASTAVWLECRFPQSCWILSERELHAGGDPVAIDPRRAGPYVHHGGGARKRPDLLVRPRSATGGLPMAVEVELSRKSADSLRAICLAWKQCPAVVGVLYLAAPRVLGPLERAVEEARAGTRIAVLALEASDVPLRRSSVFAPTLDSGRLRARGGSENPLRGSSGGGE
jgi:hypothetical protein